MRTKEITMPNGEIINVTPINNDANGNPRYVVHFLSIGVELGDYSKIPLKKYRGKSIGGGYVFQAYGTNDIISELEYAIATVKDFYNAISE